MDNCQRDKNVNRWDREHLGCKVISEKILADALVSTKSISSLPWTKQACTMDTSRS